MNAIARVLDRLVKRIESMTSLDEPADRLARMVRPLLPAGPVRDVASGTPGGHPLHPALVAVPLGAWLSAGYLDVRSPETSQDAARRLVGLGVLAALPTAATGVNDWLDTEGAERRVGLVHWALNSAAVSCYAASWLTRRRGHYSTGKCLALTGGAIVGTAGWLGGHLAYARGVGVDTTAFLHTPTEWTDVAATSDLEDDQPLRVDAGGVAVLLVRSHDGINAMLDRCTHRGAPLDEGTIDDGCIVCPWHGSRFDLRDGAVRRGPATRPQQTLEARELAGRIQVRHPGEQRSLRTNPVGS